MAHDSSLLEHFVEHEEDDLAQHEEVVVEEVAVFVVLAPCCPLDEREP